MDLSRLSDADLQAVLANNMSAVSDSGLRVLSGIPEAPKESGFFAGLKSHFGAGLDEAGTGIEALYDPNAAAKRALENSAQRNAKYADPSLLDAYQRGGAGEVMKQIPQQLGGLLGFGGEMGAEAKIGALLGGGLGTLVEPGGGTAVGARIGAMALPAAIQALKHLSGNKEMQAAQQQKDGQDIDVPNTASTIPIALAQGAIDTYAPVKILGAQLVSQITKVPLKAVMGETSEAIVANATKLAEERLRDTLMKGTAHAAAVGIPSMIASDMLGRIEAGEPLTDDEAMHSYGEALAAGTLMAPVGAAARGWERRQASQLVDAQEAAKTQAAQEAQQAAEAQKYQDPQAAAQALQAYQAAEQQRQDLLGQITKLDQKSPTYTLDQQRNKDIRNQLAKHQREVLEPLATEYRKYQVPEQKAPQEETPQEPTGLFPDAQTPTQPDKDLQGNPVKSLAPEVEDTTAKRGELQRQVVLLSDELEKHRDNVAQAATPEDTLAAVAGYRKVEAALNTTKKELVDLGPQPASSIGLQNQLAKVQKALSLAKEQGDVDKAEKLSQQAVALLEQNAGQVSIRKEDTKTPWGSETTDSFNQRVVGPEIAEGRAAAAAQRAKTDSEIAALRGIKDNAPNLPYVTDARKERVVEAEVQAMGRNPLNTGVTHQMSLLDEEKPVKRVHYGIGVDGKTEEELMQAFQAARATKNQDAARAAIESMRDLRARQLDTPPTRIKGRLAGRVEDPRAPATTTAFAQPSTEASVRTQLARLPANVSPETAALAQRVEQNLPVIALHSVEEATPLPPSTRGTAPTRLLDTVAEWLHRVSLGDQVLPTGRPIETRDTTREQEITRALDTLEQGKRSETEQQNGVVKTAVQSDMFPDERAVGKVFGTREQFEQFLASDTLHNLRTMLGETTQTLSRAVRKMLPLQRKLGMLDKALADLREQYGDAKEQHAAAVERLQAVRAHLDAELHPLQVEYIRAQLALKETTDRHAQLLEDIAANAKKFEGLNADAEKALDTLTWAQHLFKESLQHDVTKQNWDLARSAQLGVVEAAEAFKAHSSTLSKGVREFLNTDLLYQLQRREDVKSLQLLGRDFEQAKETLARAAKNQARRKVATDVREAIKRVSAAETLKVERAQKLGAENDVRRMTAAEIEAELQKSRRDRSTPEHVETQADREARDAVQRQEAQGRMERLAEIPGESVSHEALRDAQERVEQKAERKEQLQTVVEDLEVSASTRNKAKAEIRKIERDEKLVAELPEGAGEAKLHATEELEHMLRKAQHQKALVTENPTTSRKQELQKTMRRVRELTRLLADLKDRAVRAPIELKADKERDAKAEERRIRAEHMALLKSSEGTTGALPKRKKGPLVKKGTVAADLRTENADTADERKLSNRNPIVQTANTEKTSVPVGKTETRKANEVADNIEKSVPQEAPEGVDAGEIWNERYLRQQLNDVRISRKALEERVAAKNMSPASAAVVGRLEQLRENEASLTRELRTIQDTINAKAAHGTPESIADAKAALSGADTKPTAKAKAKKVKVSTAAAEVAAKRERAIRDADLTEYDNVPEFPEYEPYDPNDQHFFKTTQEKGDPINDTAKGHLANGDAGAALTEIGKTSKNEVVRTVAKLLGRILEDTTVRLEDDLRNDKGEPALGAAAKDGHNIWIDKAEGQNETTVVHEGVHAAVERVLAMPEDTLTKDQIAAKRELEALYEEYKKWGKNDGAKESVHEFVAEALSDGLVQNELKGQKWALRNAWEGFKKTILNLLGVKTPDNMLHATLAAAETLFSKPLRENPESRTLAKPEFFRSVKSKDPALFEVHSRLIGKQKTWYDKIKGPGMGLWLQQQIVDRWASLEAAAKHMDPLAGLQMMHYARMYDQAAHFVAQAVTNGVVGLHDYVRKDGRTERILEAKGGPNLKDVFKDIVATKNLTGSADVSSAMFDVYRLAKRAERVGYNTLDFTMTPADRAKFDAQLAKIKAIPGLSAKFDEAIAKYNAYNKALMGFAVDTGAIPAEAAREMLSSGDYTPFYREKNGSIFMDVGSKTYSIGSVKNQPHLHELVGGDARIVDFATGAVQNTNMLLKMGMSNLATKNAVFELAKIGMAKFVSPETTGDNVIHFKEHGERKAAVVEDAKGLTGTMLVRGMEGVPFQTTLLTKALHMPANLLRKVVTANPLFGAKQVFRDSLSAAVVSGADITPLLSSFQEVGSLAGKKLTARGITGGQGFTGTTGELARMLKDMDSGKATFNNVLAHLEAISMEADALTRRAQYNSYIKQGLSELEATHLSLESMNFTKRGASASVHFFCNMIPFMNAQIQSLNVMAKAFRGTMPFNDKLDIRNKLMMRGALLFASSAAYAAAMQNNPDYQNAQPDQKYGNWFVPNPFGDEMIRIPIPFEVGYIFKALPEALVNSMASTKGQEDALAALKTIATNVVPGGSNYGFPQLAKPLAEVGTNHSFYTGREIETAAQQKLVPWARVTDRTTDAEAAVAKALNISPAMMANLGQGYLGWLYPAMTQMFSFAVPSENNPEKAALRASDMPIVGGLFQPHDAGGIIASASQRFKNDIEPIKATYDDMVKRGKYAEANTFLKSHQEDFALSGLATKFHSVMAQLSKAEMAVKAARPTGMTGSQARDWKREQLDKIREAKTKIAGQLRDQADAFARR